MAFKQKLSNLTDPALVKSIQWKLPQSTSLRKFAVGAYLSKNTENKLTY